MAGAQDGVGGAQAGEAAEVGGDGGGFAWRWAGEVSVELGVDCFLEGALGS